jgi:Cu-Zn family superoxide dismutase
MKYYGDHGLSYLANSVRAMNPTAYASVRGSADYPSLQGTVTFYPSGTGVVVAAEFRGLPAGDEACSAGVFGFHIHEGTECTGTAEDPFANAGGHYNPGDCPHPEHAGDMPPLFGSRSGYAWQAFYTDRFTVPEVVGRTVVVHANPDDFVTQPAGNSGPRIGCGVIRSM